ncbi:hypothetical protein PR048_033487 [Dryococelus australis]|uniref:Ionotropic glutamate receptor L-glutamate and glycine-binding domain-containing protein n=1 Tax=Dryococelus australis TaxID=614101 RepID=A0ABQ9G3P9_9NEOP|nr:hypothetical protein PR048_033487 [Dryococelus australis]
MATVMTTYVVIALLALTPVQSCDKDVFNPVIKTLRHSFDLREITVIYSNDPYMTLFYVSLCVWTPIIPLRRSDGETESGFVVVDGVSCQAVIVHQLARVAGLRMSFLNLDRGCDLVNFFLRGSSMITALLALPDNQARSVLGKVLETGWWNWIQLFVLSPDPEDFLQGMYLPMSSRVLFLHNNTMTLVVKEAYHLHQSGPLLVNELGLSPEELRSKFWIRRSNMHGLTLRAGLNTFMCCLCRTQYIVSPNQGAGMVTEDGCWTGVIGMLQRNETEVGLGELTITKERSLVADFTHIYWENNFYAYIRWPTTSYVFDVWDFVAVILATIVGATLAQFVSLWFLPERGVAKSAVVFEVFYAFCQQEVQQPRGKERCRAASHHVHDESRFRLCQFSVWSTGVADTQSPRNRSRSTVLIVTQLAGFFMFSMYSATLMSRLAVQIHTHSYEEFVSLVNSTSYIVGYRRGDSSIEMTKPHLQKLNLWNYQMEDDFSNAMERVCNENYILVVEGLGPNKQAFSCLADLVPVLLGTSPLSFPLSKNSPYLGVINHQLVKMLESGHISRLRNKYIREESSAPQESKSITMMHIVPCVVSLIVGIAMSAVFLLAEWRLSGEDVWAHPSAGVLPERLETPPRPRISGQTTPRLFHRT